MEAIKIEMVDDVKSKYYSAASATRAVCEVFDIEREELLGKKRSLKQTKPRMALYYLAYQNTAHTTTTLGEYMNRDHTSVIHGIRKCKRLMEESNIYNSNVMKAHLLAMQYENERKPHFEKLKAEVQQMVDRINMERLNEL